MPLILVSSQGVSSIEEGMLARESERNILEDDWQHSVIQTAMPNQ